MWAVATHPTRDLARDACGKIEQPRTIHAVAVRSIGPTFELNLRRATAGRATPAAFAEADDHNTISTGLAAALHDSCDRDPIGSTPHVDSAGLHGIVLDASPVHHRHDRMDLTDMPTLLAVRHADIDLPPADNDPPLNPAGHRRARALARLLGPAGITAILTSEYTRTQQTVDPIAHQLGLPPQVGPSPSVLADHVRAGTLGHVVLVAGHSDTIPEIVTALGATAPPPITEAEFDNLYVITIAGDATQLVHMRYGAP